MKKALFLMLFLVIINNLFSQTGFQFGNYQWDTTIEIIKKNEGIPEYEDLQKMIYRDRFIEGYQADVKLIFFDNKIYGIDYTFSGNYSIDRWIEIYIYLEKKLKNICNYSSNETDEEIIELIKRVYSRSQGVNITANSIIDNIFVTGYVFSTLLRMILDYNNTNIQIDFRYLNILQIFEIRVEYRSPDFNKYLGDYFENGMLY
jgi:hypothetical protein